MVHEAQVGGVVATFQPETPELEAVHSYYIKHEAQIGVVGHVPSRNVRVKRLATPKHPIKSSSIDHIPQRHHQRQRQRQIFIKIHLLLFVACDAEYTRKVTDLFYIPLSRGISAAVVVVTIN
jgi:hypothetical protein